MRVLLTISILVLSACTTFERSARSGYAGRSPFGGGSDDVDPGINARFEREAREELSFGDRDLNGAERRTLAMRVRVKESEQRLAGRGERRQYYKMRGALRNDRERLDVLLLPGASARARFANARGLGAGDDERSEEVAAAIEAKDIALGMNQKAVSESWGDPDAVEVSGDKVYGVERWRYNRYVSGGEGFRKETRIVYFESGRVTGWERP